MSSLEDHRSADYAEREAVLVRVLHRLWTYSLTTKSNECREFADEVAEAASRQLITTAVVPAGSTYGRLWKLTPQGVAYLFDHAALVADEEAHYAQDYCRP
jgi:hypothetical protein